MKQKTLMKNLFKTVITLLILLGAMLMVLFVIRMQKPDEGQKDVVVTAVPTPEPTPEVHELDLLMAGDALLHGAVYTDAKTEDGDYDFDEMMSTLNRVMGSYDLKYYNQETVLGGTELGLSTYPCFNSPQQFGDTMVKLGFNLVSLANNHTLDRGEQAILNSLDYWARQQGVMTAGSYGSFEERNQLRISEMNGITYTLLSYTYGTNGIPVPEGKEYLVNVYTEEMLREDIEKARSEVDLLLVAMHWGTEYTHEPTAKQRELAQLLADLGVDVIIGSHPHVVQPIEWIDDTLCVYSLGNLISAQDGTYKRVGLLAGVHVTKTTMDGSTVVKLSDPRAELVYTQYKKGYKDFKLKFFDEIEAEELDDIWGVYDKYGKIVTSGDAGVTLGSME